MTPEEKRKLAKVILDKNMGLRDPFNERDEEKIIYSILSFHERMVSESWIKGCECPEGERLGATWCCNNCGLPTSMKESEWVDVKDKEPEHNQEVLTVSQDGWYRILKYGSQLGFPYTVTHWRELPPPPNQK